MAQGRLTKDDFEPGFLEEIEGVVGPPGPVGPSLDYQWDGTKLGVKREDEQVFTFTELKGEKGETGPQGPPGDNADLPIASETVLGGIKVDGETIFVDPETGIASGASIYALPIASTEVLGGVKVDGNTIKIDDTGTISSSGTVSVGDWIPATLVNGWTGIMSSNPKYFKDASGYVNFTGAVKGGNGIVFTFPVGYRPVSQQSIVCFAVSGDAINGYLFKGLSEARVDSLGQLDFALTYGTGTTYVLSGSFKVI